MFTTEKKLFISYVYLFDENGSQLFISHFILYLRPLIAPLSPLLIPPKSPSPLPQAVYNEWPLILNCKKSRWSRWVAFWRNLFGASSDLFDGSKFINRVSWVRNAFFVDRRFQWMVMTMGEGAVCMERKIPFIEGAWRGRDGFQSLHSRPLPSTLTPK